jgi:N-acetylmuramoyl-L-alanine amidase
VIDAGHGGNDTGTQGQAGLQEKDITLQVARRLREAIESRLGLRVVMTRDSDRTVRLDERAAIANNNKADLFISLHINSSVSETASGAVVYSLSLNDYGEETLSENRQSHTVPLLGGRTRNIEIVLWDLAQVTHVQDSALLAGFVDVELRRRINMNALTLQQAPFRVLVGANMPAVLVEMGFISNARQEEQLASLAFQDRVVQGLLQSVVTYRESLRDRWQTESSQRSNQPPAEEEP